MKRREFIAALGGAAATPALPWLCAAHAQQPVRMRSIGVLMNRPKSDRDAQTSAAVFKHSMERLGWTEGANVRIEYRWAIGEAAALRSAAIELVSLKPDVLVASATDGLKAAIEATRTIPTVFLSVSDPVGQGFVPNLARPGGHITGLTAFEFSIGGKWMDILKEIAPSISRAAVIFNPATSPHFPSVLEPIEAAGRSLGVKTITRAVGNAAEIEAAVLGALGQEPNGGLIVPSDAFTSVHRTQVIALAARHRLPAIYAFRFFPAEGGLISYGIDRVDLYRQAAFYVDRILRGANPGELPVQQPTKFEFVINLRTARALGLTVPNTLLVRADEVIE